MKELCKKIMCLDAYIGQRIDYTPIAFLFWCLESKFLLEKRKSIHDFCTFIYRFYLDNPILQKSNNFPLINNLYKYNPFDLKEYATEILHFIKNKTNIIEFNDIDVFLLSNNKFMPSDISIFENVTKLIAKRYIPIKEFQYSSKLSEKEFSISSDRLFNRTLELINYCFICDETDINQLTLIKLKSNCSQKETLDPNNYFILCKDHAEQFKNGQLIIKKNGYPYLSGKRLYNHLEIEVLKKIRNYLPL